MKSNQHNQCLYPILRHNCCISFQSHGCWTLRACFCVPFLPCWKSAVLAIHSLFTHTSMCTACKKRQVHGSYFSHKSKICLIVLVWYCTHRGKMFSRKISFVTVHQVEGIYTGKSIALFSIAKSTTEWRKARTHNEHIQHVGKVKARKVEHTFFYSFSRFIPLNCTSSMKVMHIPVTSHCTW